MKKAGLLKIALGIAPLLAIPTAILGASSTEVRDLPGYVDLGSFAPAESGGEFVEINLGPALIRFAAKVAAIDEPEVAELLDKIDSVRVNVIELDDLNRDEMRERADDITAKLANDEWEKVVTVYEDHEDVNIFAKTAPDGAIQGLTVVVIDGDHEAVFVNIVGNILPDEIAVVAQGLDIGPLKNLDRHDRS